MNELDKVAKKIRKRMEEFLYNTTLTGISLLKYKNPDFFDVVKDLNQNISDFTIPGKKLRAAELVWGYKLVNGRENDEIYDIAMSVDLPHQSTLIFDDIQDRDVERRGQPTVWFHHALEYLKKFNPKMYEKLKDAKLDNMKFSDMPSEATFYGNSQALNSGQITAIRTYRPFAEAILSNSFDPKRIAEAQITLIDALTKVAFGQTIDIYCAHAHHIPTVEDYQTIVRLKTTPLHSASVEIGIILGNGTPSQRKCAREASDPAFMAFQIKDDLLDMNIGGIKGHALGSDIKERKVTFTTAKFFELSNKEQQKIFYKAYGNENATLEDVEAAISVQKECGVISIAEEECKKLVKEAQKKLEEANPPFDEKAKEWFKLLFSYIGVDRKE